ncbi:MAG: hypothetical protein AAF573_10530 [Bacteroidota bacterium]
MSQKKSALKLAFENMMMKRKVENHLHQLVRRVALQEKAVIRLQKIMEKEEGDLYKFDSKNLLTFFRKVLGDQLDQLEKERQEYLMAVLQVQDAEKKLKAMHYEKEVLQKQLSSLFRADEIFEKIFKETERGFELLLDKKTKAKLQAIQLRILNHEERIKEIRQAIGAGKKAEKVLLKIIEDLSQIKQWGNSFIPNNNTKIYGKGTASSRGKQKFIDLARKDAQRTHLLLERFELEILDVYKQFKIDYRGYLKSFENFLEIFYDNLITDWIVKKNVKNTIHTIETIHDKVVRILAMLENEIIKTKEYIKEEKLVRKEIIVKY